MAVKLPLTDLEATELEYAIRYRIDGLKSPSVGCQDCIKGACIRHENMRHILHEILDRLIQTGFSLKS